MNWGWSVGEHRGVGPKNEMCCAGVAWGVVVWKLGMESFICLLDDSKHPSGHSQVDCDKTNPSDHLSLDSNFAWGPGG